MNYEQVVGIRRALLPLIILGVGSCGSPKEPTVQEAAETSSDEPLASAFDDYVAPRDFAGTDICALLPGEVVATATNAQLIGAQSNLDPAWCRYTVRGDEPYDTGIHVGVDGVGMLYTMGRQTASTVEAVPGIGADAWMKKTVDNQIEINIKREDAVYIQVIAGDRDSALAVARLAIDAVPE